MRPTNPYRKFFAVLIFCGLALLFMPVVQAEGDEAWQSALKIYRALFATQGALFADDTAKALLEIEAAEDEYRQTLRPLLATLPEITRQLDADFEAVRHVIAAGDVVSFAGLRGKLWTTMLNASAQMTLQAIEHGDAEAAASWLLLREFRPSTSVSRPRADATQEIYALRGGRRDADDVYAVVRADLYDAYQFKLSEALREADAAHDQGFTARQAEEVHLASGYFAILAPAYVDQFGQDRLAGMQARFDELAGCIQACEDYAAIRAALDDGLSDFAAAPLTPVELSQRAGHLLRFLSLIPLEYDRGVRDGRVIDDVEYQEALTFQQSAWSTYRELKAALGSSSTDIDAHFDELGQYIETLADPAIIRSQTFEIATVVSALLPSDWRSINSAADIQAIRLILNQVRADAQAGLFDEALAACGHVYMILEESLDQKLQAFAPDVALRLDALLWQGQPGQPGLAVLVATGASINDIENALMRLNAALDEAETALNLKIAPEAVMGNAAIVVLREGLEASLILAALLASLRSAESRGLRRLLLGGAGLALVAALISGMFMTGVLRSFTSPGAELEALVSLAALAVMLLVTNWFFHKAYWTDHLAGLHARKTRLARGGHMVGLFALGFTSVFREGIETALFLQPLSLNADYGQVLSGAALGLAGVMLIGLALFNVNARLPYKKLLIVTGILIGVALVTLVGNTVYSLQIAGWLPISPFGLIFIPRWLGQWLGVYPTWQGVALQIAAAGFTAGSYLWLERRGRAT
jgi:high-affinity iron transporter